jgi:DNA adenine methylase
VTRFLSPLRYPGGKARLAPYFARVIGSQPEQPRTYAEPFAGGAGAALELLIGEHVSAIHLNDLNPGIAAFWRAVAGDADELAARVEGARVGMPLWHKSRDTYFSALEGNRDFSDVELGFATFVLNRCNRSGILNARPIGGLKQDGTWKLDARFNKEELASRIRRIGTYGQRIAVTELDARTMIRNVEQDSPRSVFLYVDPPYLGQGDGLYMNSLSLEDHGELASVLAKSSALWLVTYDADPRIAEKLYKGFRCVEFRIAHTAARQHIGLEWAVFSRGLHVPGIDLLPTAEAQWVVA